MSIRQINSKLPGQILELREPSQNRSQIGKIVSVNGLNFTFQVAIVNGNILAYEKLVDYHLDDFDPAGLKKHQLFYVESTEEIPY